MSQNLFVKSPLPVHDPIVFDIEELNHRIYFGYHDYFQRVVMCYQRIDKGNPVTHFAIDVAEWIKSADVCTDPECDCDRYDSLIRFIINEMVAYQIMTANDLNHNATYRQISKDYLAFVYGNNDFGVELYKALRDSLPKFIGFAQKPLTTRPQ